MNAVPLSIADSGISSGDRGRFTGIRISSLTGRTNRGQAAHRARANHLARSEALRAVSQVS